MLQIAATVACVGDAQDELMRTCSPCADFLSISLLTPRPALDMTFDRAGEIQYGDWVIVYHVRARLPSFRVVSRRLTLPWSILPQSRTQLTSEIVTRDKELQSRFGHFRHSDMVGKPWGTKLSSSNGRGFVFLLKPTPELWYVDLHRLRMSFTVYRHAMAPIASG